MNTYLAVDFGGGSGRVMAGTIDNGRLTLEEVYRFPNRQIRMGNYIYWDFLALFGEMKTGLRLAAHKGYSIKSIGIDTWGVDFVCVGKDGHLLRQPYAYRDGLLSRSAHEWITRRTVRAYGYFPSLCGGRYSSDAY